MSRWIDADELMAKLDIKDDCLECNSNDNFLGCLRGSEFVDACEAILEAPSIDIVRCGECKHWHKKDELTYCDRIDYGYGYKTDDFCSYGSRSEIPNNSTTEDCSMVGKE